MMNRGQATARELARLIGLYNSTCAAVPLAPLHYRALQRLKNCISHDYDSPAPLDGEALADLQFWTHIPQAYNGRQIQSPAAMMTIYSDVSTQGWGAACNNTRTGGPWTAQERRNHINYLELKAVFLGLQTFAAELRDQHIRLMMDNTTAVAYLNHKGGTHLRSLSDLAIHTWLWCQQRNLTVHAEHLPGILNTQADQESRRVRDSSEWMLNRRVFQQIMDLWGPCSVDLFAARHSAQLSTYYSF